MKPDVLDEATSALDLISVSRIEDLAVELKKDYTTVMVTHNMQQAIADIAAGEDGERCLDLLMIAKYFERIGEYSTNIAQWVEYAITRYYEDD